MNIDISISNEVISYKDAYISNMKTSLDTLHSIACHIKPGKVMKKKVRTELEELWSDASSSYNAITDDLFGMVTSEAIDLGCLFNRYFEDDLNVEFGWQIALDNYQSELDEYFEEYVELLNDIEKGFVPNDSWLERLQSLDGGMVVAAEAFPTSIRLQLPNLEA